MDTPRPTTPRTSPIPRARTLWALTRRRRRRAWSACWSRVLAVASERVAGRARGDRPGRRGGALFGRAAWRRRTWALAPRALELHRGVVVAAGHVDPLRAHPADRRRARARSSGCSGSRSSSCARRPPPPTPTSTGWRRPTPTGSGSSCSTSPASMTSSELPPPPAPPPPDGPWVAGPPPTRPPVPIDTPSRTSPLTIALEAIGLAFFGVTLARQLRWPAGRPSTSRARDRLRLHAAADGRLVVPHLHGHRRRRHPRRGHAPEAPPGGALQPDPAGRAAPAAHLAAVRDRHRPHRDGRRRRRHRHQPAVPRLPTGRGAARPPAGRAAARAGRPARRAAAARARSGPRPTAHRPARPLLRLSPGRAARWPGSRAAAPSRRPSLAVVPGRGPRRRSTSTAPPRCWRSSRSWSGITLAHRRPRRGRLAAQRLGRSTSPPPTTTCTSPRACSTAASTRCRATASSTSG